MRVNTAVSTPPAMDTPSTLKALAVTTTILYVILSYFLHLFVAYLLLKSSFYNSFETHTLLAKYQIKFNLILIYTTDMMINRLEKILVSDYDSKVVFFFENLIN